MSRVTLALAPLTLLAACAGHAPRPAGIVERAPPTIALTGWRAVATLSDQQRLTLLPSLWPRAVAAVPRRAAARLKAEGALVDPAGALELPAPPPGPYYCRLLRFGGQAGLRTFKPDICYIEGDSAKLSFTKQTGGSLPGGWLYPDGTKRLVFLGATPSAGSKTVPLYGKHPAQDVTGLVERVSPFRWRLTLSRAARGAVMDVYELVPVPPEVPGAMPAVPAKS